jgi:broad specificity phosphatase PhoE
MPEADKQKLQVMTMRHLEDRDTLSSEGRNNSLKEGQELRVKSISHQIIKNAMRQNLRSVIFYASEKKRTQQTVELIQNRISQSKLIVGTEQKITSSINELDNGEMVFPEGYKDGDWFQPLPDAWDSFFREIFEGDLTYRFGDPKISEKGESKYPKIDGHFKMFGENYAEFCSRIFEFLSELDVEKDFREGKLPVIITHNAIVSVVIEVAYVYYDLFKKDANFINDESGPSLNKLIWDMFLKYKKEINFDMCFGEIKEIDLGFLADKDFKSYLKNEAVLLSLVAKFSS